MPTTRTRRSRFGRLLPEHVAWAHSDDARRFFTQTEDYEPYYAGKIQRLPGVGLSWPPLRKVWLDPVEPAYPPYGGQWPRAVEFVNALHEEYLTGNKR